MKTSLALTNRDNGLWLKFWRDNRVDFHQKSVNQLLSRFWHILKPAPGSRIFVPLCGKSQDMIWLAQQGHEVIGVELSPVAVKAFFRENHLQPCLRKMGSFTLWEYGKISILCGDFFALLKNDLGLIDMVYDRAALTALPLDIRSRYAVHLQAILPSTVKVFLLTTEDIEPAESLQKLDAIDTEINGLFSADFEIDLIHAELVSEATHAKVYGLTSRVILPL